MRSPRGFARYSRPPPEPLGRRSGARPRALEDPDRVAEGIPDAHVRAVEVFGRLLREVGDAALLQRLVQRPGVVREEDETDQGALADQLAELLGRGVVVEG